MTSEPVHSRTADVDLFLPAGGLSLLGEYQGSGYAGSRFLVGRGDGQAIQLPLLLYLIMAAIAEGAVDGGWSADQVGARVGTASGQGLTADTVRYLVAGQFAPLGLIAADGADRPDSAPGAVGRALSWPVGRALSWPVVGRVERLLLLHRRRWRWALGLALGAAAVLVSIAATAPIMAETGNRTTSGTWSASASASASADAAAAAAAISGSQAAAWVAQQVSPDVTVSCDPGMCRQLQRDGFPAARLKPLPRSARALLGSGIVVATPAIRSQFGPRLAVAYAPQVIASFGSGAARVDVRTIAPTGTRAVGTRLAAEQAALVSAARQLLSNRNIQASPSGHPIGALVPYEPTDPSQTLTTQPTSRHAHCYGRTCSPFSPD